MRRSIAQLAFLSFLALPVLAAVPKLAELVSAKDIDPLVRDVIDNLQTDLADAATFRQAETRFEHAAYTLALYAEAVAQANGSIAWSAQARAVRDLAIKLAKTKNYNQARDLLERIKNVVSGTAPAGAAPAELAWEEVAPLVQVMKEVNLVNRSLRRYVRRERYFKRYRDRLDKAAVAMTVLAYIASHDNSAAKEPPKPIENAVQRYDQYSAQFVELSKLALDAVRKGSYDEAKAAVTKLQDVCAKCHEDFRPGIEF